MTRVAPSTRIRHEIDQLLTAGADPDTNLLTTLTRLGLRYLAQQALEQEQEDFLGRGRYRRRDDGDRGWRNGYQPARLRTAEGGVPVELPQVRDAETTYRSRLIDFLAGNSAALERLVTEMYARGLSTRDVEDCFRGPDGELLISRSAVSAITDQLWEDYQAFCARDLSELTIEYLFVDAIFESLRRHGAKEGILAAWGVTGEGRKVLLGLAVGNRESEAAWTEFFRDLVARGLRPPLSVTADGAPGLINAIEACFAGSLRIRCWYHKLGNLHAKLPAEAADEVLAHVRAVRDAPTLEAGTAAAAAVVERFERTYPAAMVCLVDDLDASLAHLRLPVRHRIHVRTTNLIERSFEEERRRTKIIPRFTDERSAMKLVFAVLIRAAERWSRVSISELERVQLKLLRRELGLDPPPREEVKAHRTRVAA